MRRATQEDFDTIASLLTEIYEESIWKELGPYDYDISCQHIRDIIDNSETYMGDGLVSVNVSKVYHTRPVASVIHFAPRVKLRSVIDEMFQVVDNVCLSHNCLAVFFIPDTILSGAFQSSFSNMMQKRGYTVFSNMYWRNLNG